MAERLLRVHNAEGNVLYQSNIGAGEVGLEETTEEIRSGTGELIRTLDVVEVTIGAAQAEAVAEVAQAEVTDAPEPEGSSLLGRVFGFEG